MRKHNVILIQLFVWLFGIQVSFAQGDTTKISIAKDTVLRKDSVILKKETVVHSPRKAALYSTILPGLGQAYNKKYWKIPVLYAGIAGLTYSIIFYNNDYLHYRHEYRIRMDTIPSTIDLYADKNSKTYMSTEVLLANVKHAHRWRDLSIFGAALVYVLNIVDATVDAHLFSFDVSDDLSMRIQPIWINTTAGVNNWRSPVTGLSVHLNF